ncbi:MAG: hypothetical protein GY754_00830, partial [bacterium]|nr:hypothetical protein [bacterium]
MKRVLSYLLIILSIIMIMLIFIGCGQSGFNQDGESEAPGITAFSFEAAKNPALAEDVTGVIDETNITAAVPYGTNVTGLVATFTTTGRSVQINELNQASGTTVNDFTNDVIYTVTEEDWSTREYTVMVTISPDPWIGTRQMGTTDNDWAAGVSVDSTGNIYVAGYTSGGLDGNTNAGLADIFLVKYNSLGEKEWTRQMGTTESDCAHGVSVDIAGNIYVVGYTSGGLDGNTNDGGRDIFLVKYSSLGEKQWTRQMGTTENDYACGVSVDSAGNIYITGDTEGGLDGNTHAGDDDIFLVKYNSLGVKQWTRQMGTTEGDYARGVSVDSFDNIYITGFTYGGLDGNTHEGGSDIFLVKYNSLGEKQWTRQMGTTTTDRAMGVSVDSFDNIYITGFTSGGLDGNTHEGGSDIFLVKYNSLGEKQWTRQMGTTESDYVYGVSVDSTGNIYITGCTEGGLDGNTNDGGWDIFLVKYNSLGVKQWTRQMGTTENDYA